MHVIRGYYRLTLAAFLLIFWGTLVVITSWFPFSVRNIALPGWMTYFAAKTLAWALGFKVHCDQQETIKQHEGFLFANHVSFMDIIVLVTVTPLRFVAKIETLKVPIIGQAAKGIKCVFVDRSNKASRHAARDQIAAAEKFPAIAIYPEGTRGSGKELLPFRHGAFELAQHGQVPILPVAIKYDPPTAVSWGNEGLVAGGWRLASQYQRVYVTLTPLPVVTPTPNDDPTQLANQMRDDIGAIVYPAITSPNPEKSEKL
ncbi:MAG: 1-acylglycerol-3-phosphate O-acyltransferase [Chloroflexota bacterium]